MKKTVVLLGLLVFTFTGCSMVVGDRVVGVDSGKFIYTDGTAKSDFRYSYDRVWDAAVKTINDMKPSSIATDRKISRGEIDAVVSDEKVKLTVAYSAADETAVSVRVGLTGNKLVSQMVLDRIKENLAKE